MIVEAVRIFLHVVMWMSAVACGLVVGSAILLAGYALLYGLVMRVIRTARDQ